MRGRTAGFIAEHGDQSVDAAARVGGRGLVAGGRVGGTPYLLVCQTEWDEIARRPTCRELHVRLKAANRSVGDVARKLLVDKEREPPIRRDHCSGLVSGDAAELMEAKGSYKVHGSATTA